MDTPVKRYSSGMYLRLGFSIAAHLEADILVVDEVLAVGDAEFQRQCLGKMSEAERSGRSVLFVSHNLDAVARLCPRTIWIADGTVKLDGPSGHVLAEYMRSTHPVRELATFDPDPSMNAQVLSVALVDGDGHPCAVLANDQAATIAVDVIVAEPVPGLDVGLLVSTSTGLNILDEAHSDTSNRSISERGRYRLRCPLPPILPPGDYGISVWLGTAYETLQELQNRLQFSVEGDDGGRPNRLVKLAMSWDVEALE
jgi:hypothetical protein